MKKSDVSIKNDNWQHTPPKSPSNIVSQMIQMYEASKGNVTTEYGGKVTKIK
jgi:hypothetical protein